MPSFRSTVRRPLFVILCLPALAGIAAFVPGVSSATRPAAHTIYTTIHGWLTNSVAGSAVENVLFRQMNLPTGSVMFPRPPKESTTAITALIHAEQKPGELYALRAVQEEQALNFPAAEADWKAWVRHAPDHAAAELDLAHFYARRLRPHHEIAALESVAKAPNPPAEKFTAVSEQRSWQAFQSLLKVIHQFALGSRVTDQVYSLWIARYPQEPSVYSNDFHALLKAKRYSSAASLIVQYRKAFPHDDVFPMQAEASLAYHQQSVAAGLAVYNKSFDPLWPTSLIHSYYALLQQTHSLPAFIDHTRATLAAHPDDFTAAAKLFLAWQQQNHPGAALQVIARYRRGKQLRHASWSAQELYTFATLLKRAHYYPQAARYYFALYNSTGMPSAKQRALSGLIEILLTAPEQSLRLGEGNLSLYRDIATMDQGPGYLNGILSLLLNTTQPADQYAQENQRATPYFHRAEAARLLAKLDHDFPNAPQRAALHAKMISAYAAYGEDKAVIRAGQAFLADFPHAPQRLSVALTMADSYARTHQTAQEFALYQQLLRELATQAGGVPLGDGSRRYSSPVKGQSYNDSSMDAQYPGQNPNFLPGSARTSPQAFAAQRMPRVVRGVRSPQYERVLNRYLARLVALHRLPQALQVLRNEVQHDPDDPGIYNRLAQFLEQNQLGANAAEVYQKAIEQFNRKGWYDKLARFYLRQKRNADYLALTHKVAKIFDGTALEAYLRAARTPNQQLALQVNLYAHHRFPHDLSFVYALLRLYRSRLTPNPEAARQLLAQYWFASEQLRNQFFEMLARRGQLNTVLASLDQQRVGSGAEDWSGQAEKNPAAVLLYTDAKIWQSHFAAATPAAAALADAYPANTTYGSQAASLYRSLAYFHPDDTARAVAIDKQLLSANPADLDLLARIGDTYADKDHFADAAPYWVRMGQVHPGETGGYLQAATVFWDYFDFHHALAELNRGRRASGNPAQYSYEEGAIYENQKDYPAAIAEYVRGAVAKSPDTRSRYRLLYLAQRPKLQNQVDRATAALLTQDQPSAADIRLRADILTAQKKTSELATELSQLVARSTALDTLATIEQIADQDSLFRTQQQALQREITLTKDPTRRLQLQYDLAHSYVKNNQLADAQSLIDSTYHANPKILGVVRATVDFDWSHNHKQEAVAVLQQAAAQAYPGLARQFNFEAAHKLIDTQQYAQARSVLATILQSSPFNATALALTAQTYARAGDNQGLAQFDQSQIAALQKSSLSASDREQKIAALRRGLIPALTRLHKPAAAVDQYIALLRAYPEDTGLAGNAALYARKHQQQPRLLGYFRKATQESPRNPHWPIILARLQTTLENYPAAISAYSKALGVRPNRVDLHTARAAIYEKLQQYDNAIADYKALYHLTYQDPSWMVKIAEDRAREGNAKLASAALEAAFITGRAPKPQNDFTVARHLASWNMLEPALQFATTGVRLAGTNMLAEPRNHSGAALYASILTRLGKPGEAFATLAQAFTSAKQGPTIASDVAHAESHGIVSILNSQWRASERDTRMQNARQGFTIALKAMTEAAHRYDTPEQTAAFAALLQSKAASASLRDVSGIFLPAAQAGKLSALTAHLQWRLIQSQDKKYSGVLASWVHLQKRRLLQRSAAHTLEQFAPSVSADRRNSIYIQAAKLYGEAGDAPGELRCLNSVAGLDQMQGSVRATYFSLLLKKDPQKLVGFASSGPSSSRNAAAQFAVLHASPSIALQAVAARGQGLHPVWSSSYAALTGLYLRQTNNATASAFQQALGSGTIAERLAHPVDRTQQLAGAAWFYYGARYGEYLALSRSNSAEDYLPAALEAEPRNPQSYEQLAAWYTLRRQTAQAFTEYGLALQLAPHDPLIQNHIALLLWSQGHKHQAVAAWQQAVADLARQMNAHHVPGTFWSSFSTVVSAIGAHSQLDSVHGQLNTMLSSYIRRNGAFRTMPLLKAVYKADGRTVAAAQWIISLPATLNSNGTEVLNQLRYANWIVPAQRPYVTGQLVASELQRHSTIRPHSPAENRLRQLTLAWIQALLQAKDYARAETAVRSMVGPDEKAHPEFWLPVTVRLAAYNHNLETLIASWRQDPAHAPKPSQLRKIAPKLDTTSRDTLMAYVYENAIASNDLASPNFLGLAAIRIRQGDISSAVSLLNRLVLVSPTTYADLQSSGSLLYKTGHFRSALPFLRRLTKGEPWNAAARLHYDLARVRVGNDMPAARKDLAALASNPLAPYATRTMAAQSLAGTHTAGVSGSAELTLLARGSIKPAEAQQPYFVAARIAAAKAAPAQDRISLLRQVIGMAPGNLRARITLLHSAIHAHQNHLVLNTARPLIASTYSYHPYSFQSSTLTAAGLKTLKPSEQAALYAGIAAAYRAAGQLADARSNFKTASKLEPNAATSKPWLQAAEALKQTMRRNATNASRAPNIHSDLGQNHAVWPRLLPTASLKEVQP